MHNHAQHHAAAEDDQHAMIVPNLYESLMPEKTSDELKCGVPLADRPKPVFVKQNPRDKYKFAEIPLDHYTRYAIKPGSQEATRLKQAARNWEKKHFNKTVFEFEDEESTICVWRDK